METQVLIAFGAAMVAVVAFAAFGPNLRKSRRRRGDGGVIYGDGGDSGGRGKDRHGDGDGKDGDRKDGDGGDGDGGDGGGGDGGGGGD
jgi:hypothetical protein